MAGLAELFGSIQTAVYFLIALLIIVTVHEFGHYLVGRLCGIHATTFSLGFGPRLVSRRDRRGTLWQISALPLGGYVKFLGDIDSASAKADEKEMAILPPEERRRTLHGAPLWARMLTVAAGPAANVLLTAALLAGTIAIGGIAVDKPVVGVMHTLPGITNGLKPGDRILSIDGQKTPDLKSYFEVATTMAPAARVTYDVMRAGHEVTVTDGPPMPPLVLDVQPKSAALDAGIQPGDVVLAIDGHKVTNFSQMPPIVEGANGKPVTMEMWRAGKTFTLTLTPRRRDLPDGKGGFETRWLVGITGGALFDPALRHPGPVETVTLAGQETWNLLTTNVSGITHMLTGAISPCNLSGPIGMAEVVGQAARTGLDTFVQMVAVISLGIGLANLLPIPVLDGGHLVFHLYEAVMRRPPSARAMQLLTLIGLALLIGLMLFSVSNDLTCS